MVPLTMAIAMIDKPVLQLNSTTDLMILCDVADVYGWQDKIYVNLWYKR